MTAHLGRHEVARRKQKLETTYQQVRGATLSPELTAHFSRYLCVILSGYAEQSVKELLAQYVRVRSEQRILRHHSKQMKRVQNIDKEKLKQVLESFDPQWWSDLSSRFADELLAFDSVATIRNSVSHGGDSGVTLATIRQYIDQVETVIRALSTLLDPP